MTTSNPLLDNQLNTLVPALEPLPPHVTLSHGLALRQSYATLLAALLTSQTSISAGQQQLFTRLLGAMELTHWQTSLLAQSQGLESSALDGILQALRAGGFALPLLTEALLLLRIDGPLDAAAAGRIAQLAQCLGGTVAMQDQATQWAAAILGLKGEEWGKLPFHAYSVSVARHFVVDRKFNPEVKSGSRVNKGALLMNYRKDNSERALKSTSAGLVFFNIKTLKDRRDYKFVVCDFPASLDSWRELIDLAALAEEYI